MASVDLKTIRAKIKQGELSGAYYIYGADVAEVEDTVRRLVSKATGGNESMALTKFDGNVLNLKQRTEAAETLMRELSDAAELFPMMSPFNCILINDFNAEKCPEEQLKKLFSIIESAGEQTVIVFSVTGFDVKDGKKYPTPKNKKLIDKIAKNGTVFEAVQKTSAELSKQMTALAQKNGCTMSLRTAEMFAARCMGDTIRMRSELLKLCAFADGREITEEMIKSMVAPSLETTVYELARAVISLRSTAAMEELDRLYAMRTERVFIVHAIASAFMDLYRACMAWRSNKNVPDMQNDFDYRFDFVVKNAFRDCRRIPPERIRACISILRDLEQKLNSSAADERVLMETAIVRMLETASGRMEPLYDKN